MLARTLLFAICAVVLALAVGQTAPGWLASVRPEERTVSEVALPAPPVSPPPAATPLGNGRRVALRTGPDGHVTVDGSIDGRSVRFLVDTGATTVVLNEATARRLGYRLSRSDFTQMSRTANGPMHVAPVRLGNVRIAGIALRDVEAVVVPGNLLDGNLLGMSFLKRLRKFEFQGDSLVLVQ
jgi:aspartyl protease family protein